MTLANPMADPSDPEFNADDDYAILEERKERITMSSGATRLGYTDDLDCDVQITAEESIAALISNFVEGYSHTEHGYKLTDEDCAELGRQILIQVLEQFRPDLVEQRRDDNGRGV